MNNDAKSIKLLLDEDGHVPLARALQNRGYDALHVSELQRKGKSDAEQLAYATAHERCLMSFNVKDFVLLHAEYLESRKEHYGIIVSKQFSVGQTLKRLLRVLQRLSRESMKNRIEFL